MHADEHQPAGGPAGATSTAGATSPAGATSTAGAGVADPREALRRPGARPLPEAAGLPFDIYQRYRLVADVVERLAAGRPWTVLDVGGSTGVLRRFLPEYPVALVDVQPSAEPGLVLGDGGRLPFLEDAFDLVVACDTLEHVPDERREAFLAECARVARRGVIVAGPYRAERVDEAEETLRAFLREKLGFEHRYLEEHRANGLPLREETEQALAVRGFQTASLGHGNLERWLALLCTSMYMDRDPHLRRVAESVYRFYNAALYESDRVEPVYRHAVVAVRPGVHLPSAEELFGPAVAPEGSIEPFVHLAAELFAFDRERDVYDAERARLGGVIAGLVRDLEGHRERVATLAADLEGHRATVTTLAADLEGHRETLRRLRDERDQQLAVLEAREQDLDGHRRQADALREELERHRGHQAELEEASRRASEAAGSMRAEHERERSGQMAVIEVQARELEEHRKLAAALREELETRRSYGESLEAELQEVHALAARVNAEAQRLDAELAAERGENEALRAELASRWRSLKRALRRVG
jgi:SAM-dependent methyltransferase